MILPLKGTKVIDLGRLLPGPYCTKILRDLGCEVTKISLPRFRDPLVDTWPAFNHLYKGKKMLTLDFQKPHGKEKLLELVCKSDVLVEGFRPGALAKLGLGYKDLKKINPGLIYCSISGYGQTGPWRRWGGHDLNYVGFSGILSLGSIEQGATALPGTQISDYPAALYAAIGILGALVRRGQSGEGAYIDISMLDSAFSFNLVALADLLNTNKEKFHGSELLFGKEPFYNLYKTKDNRYLVVASVEHHYRERLLGLLGKPELKHLSGPELKNALQNVFKKKTLKEWRVLLEPKEVCVSGLLDLKEAAHSEQIGARKMLRKVKGKWEIGSPIKYS